MSVSTPQLGGYIKGLSVAAGSPPVRSVARHLGYTANTIYAVYRGENGNWPTIQRVVKHLSHDPAHLAKVRQMWVNANTDRDTRPAAPPSPQWALDLAGQLDDILVILTRIERIMRWTDHGTNGDASPATGGSTVMDQRRGCPPTARRATDAKRVSSA